MSLLGKKELVINKLKSLSSLKDGLDSTNLTSFIENNNQIQSNNPISFILEILNTILGNSVLDRVANDFFIQILPNLENNIKTIIFNNLVNGIENMSIPSNLKLDNNSFNIPISNLDVNNLYLINPSSDNSFYYGNDNINKNIYRNVITSNSGTYFNLLDTISLKKNNSSINLKVNQNINTVQDLYYNIIFDSTFNLFDKNKVVTNIAVDLFNYNLDNRTTNDVLKYQTIIQLIDNISQDKNNPFDINKYKGQNIQDIVEKRSKGEFSLVYGVDNGYTKRVSFEGINSLINRDNTAKAFSDLNVNATPKIDLTNAIKSPLTFVDSSINLQFKYLFFEAITNQTIFTCITDPKLKLLLNLNQILREPNNSSFNDNDSQKELIEDYNKYSSLIITIHKEISKQFICYLFNILKKEILNIVKPIVLLILYEKINKYKNLYLSLLGIDSTAIKL